jgi:hypothetical protein
MKRSKHQRPGSKETPGSKLQSRGIKLVLVSGLCTFGLGLWTSLAAQTTDSSPGRTEYRNFEIIPKKNIFNPRRSPAYVPSEKPQRVSRRTESLALVGVMSNGKGPMAFFEGSRSDYRKVLKPNDSIAGFKVTAIEPSSVKLVSNTNEIEVQVGMQLAREEEGEWKLSMRPESLESTYAHATPLRSASQVNSERAAEADQNANPFANAIGSFFANGGNGFSFPGGGNQVTQNQPVVAPIPNSQPQAAPASASDILARLAARRQQETGEAPPDQPTGPTSDQGGSPPNPRGQSPQPPQNQPVRDQNGQIPPGQQPVDQSGQPLPIQPGQEPPNQ